MKKRLRKKLRLKEFQELGFILRFKHSEPQDAFCNEFIDFIESLKLIIGGCCGNEWDVFVAPSARGNITESQQLAIQEWLRQRGTTSDLRLSTLIDVWYTSWDKREKDIRWLVSGRK